MSHSVNYLDPCGALYMVFTLARLVAFVFFCLHVADASIIMAKITAISLLACRLHLYPNHMHKVNACGALASCCVSAILVAVAKCTCPFSDTCLIVSGICRKQSFVYSGRLRFLKISTSHILSLSYWSDLLTWTKLS